MIYLPDTNAFSAFLAGKSEKLVVRMKEAFARAELRLSAMVAAELEFGAEKARLTIGETKFSRRVHELRKQLPIEPLGDSFPSRYAEVRSQLELKGSKIGDRDTIMAAHALALRAVLVTANVGEFSRVEGLKLQDWQS